jgi:hypothetical protein
MTEKGAWMPRRWGQTMDSLGASQRAPNGVPQTITQNHQPIKFIGLSLDGAAIMSAA